MGKASRSKQGRPPAFKGEAAILAHRCASVEKAISDLYPGCFKQLEAARRKSAHTWPEWCWVPSTEMKKVIAGTPRQQQGSSQTGPAEPDDHDVGEYLKQFEPEINVLSDEERAQWLDQHRQEVDEQLYQHHLILDGYPMLAVAHWRQGRGIYRISSELADALAETELTGDIPGDILFRLPEWGLILSWEESGFICWAHLDWVDQRPVLRILVDPGLAVSDERRNDDRIRLVGVGIQLDAPSLADGLMEVLQREAPREASEHWWRESFLLTVA